MSTVLDELLTHLLQRLRQVQQSLNVEPVAPNDFDARLGEQLDSMGLVEYIALVAEDCGVDAEVIENSVQQQFGTVRELAESLRWAGLVPREVSASPQADSDRCLSRNTPALCWLGGVALRLPEAIQSADELDALLQREPGWLLRHTGISQRHIWQGQDPLKAAVEAGLASLRETGLLVEEVGALLVTSEAPPQLAGLAAALHDRLNLRPEAVPLEVGGACTGFLAALWLARWFLPEVETALLLSVEAPSFHLKVKPGLAGEAAALFGDAAAACVISRRPVTVNSLPLLNIHLEAHGAAGDCLQVKPALDGGAEIDMNGPRLANLAIRVMAEQLSALSSKHTLSLAELQAILVHGGNGRMPALLARRLHLPPDRIWSQTAETGNLGSASLPAAWAANQHRLCGPMLWAAAGAGLTSAVALTGNSQAEGDLLKF